MTLTQNSLLFFSIPRIPFEYFFELFPSNIKQRDYNPNPTLISLDLNPLPNKLTPTLKHGSIQGIQDGALVKPA